MPFRTCVGCGRVRAKSELIRLAATGDRRVVTLDPAGRLPGRGAYLCRDAAAACWVKARRRRGLVSRSLRLGHDVIEDSALGEQLRRLNEE